MAGHPLPAVQVSLPVGGRDQRQHGVIVTGAENIDDPVILQIPEQRAAIHGSVHPVLKIGIRQHLQQGAGQRQVNPADVLVIPQRTGNTVHGKQNFPGLPFVVLPQMLQIAGWLVQIQHQRVIEGVRHDSCLLL